jgi:hypothetical protein
MLATCIASAQSEVQGINASSQEENLSTPEETWNQFRKALLEGNYDLAMEYCCPDKNKAVNRYKRLGKVKTSRIFKNIKSIEKVYQDDDVAQFMVHRDIKGKNLTTYMSFAKIDNQWKIDKY